MIGPEKRAFMKVGGGGHPDGPEPLGSMLGYTENRLAVQKRHCFIGGAFSRISEDWRGARRAIDKRVLGKKLLGANSARAYDHSVYPRCTSLGRFCGFSPFCCFVEPELCRELASRDGPTAGKHLGTLRILV